MRSKASSFKKIINFQTCACIVFSISAIILSFFATISVEPACFYDYYFDERIYDKEFSTSLVEDFDIGVVNVVSGVPQLIEAILFDGLGGAYIDSYSASIEEFLEKDDIPEKQELTMYAYIMFSALDQNLFVGVMLLIQLLFLISLPIICVVCLVKVLHGLFVAKDYLIRFQKISKEIKPIIPSILFGVILSVFLPTVTLSLYGKLMLAVLMLLVISNSIAIRIKEYTRAQRKYVTVLQLGSFVSIAFTILYFVALFRSGLPQRLIRYCNTDTWELFEVLSNFGAAISLRFKEFFWVILTFIFIMVSLSVKNILSKSLCRAFCNTQQKYLRIIVYPDTFTRSSLTPAVSMLLIAFFLIQKNAFPEGDEFIWFLILIGSAIFVVLTELIIRLLLETLCIDLASSGKETILRGDVYDRHDQT